nr:hypothetical protein [Neobacillus sp. Marseille-Q6967]
MKRLLLFVLFLLLLTGCESEKRVDNLVKEYVKEKYGIAEIEITYRGQKDESNMGDRGYVVKSITEPSFEFAVHLEGLLRSKITGDDYLDQEEAYYIGEEFFKAYDKELKAIGYSDIMFKHSYSDNPLLTVLSAEAVTDQKISLNQEPSIENLFKLIQLLNEYNKILEPKEFQVTTLWVNYPEKQILGISDIVVEINEVSQLKTYLLEKTNFLNEALLEANLDKFKQLEKELVELGFEYGLGFNNRSIYCYGKDIANAICTGYSLNIKGEDKSEENIQRLKDVIKNFELPIAQVVIQNDGGAIVLEEFN